MSEEPYVPERLICRCCKREVNCINGWFLCEVCTEYQEEVVDLIVKHCENRGMDETATSIKNGNWAPDDWPPSRPRCVIHGDSMVIDLNKDAVCSICEGNAQKADVQEVAVSVSNGQGRELDEIVAAFTKDIQVMIIKAFELGRSYRGPAT